MGKSISEVLEEGAFYQNLKPYGAYHPYPVCSDRDFWETIHTDVKKRLIDDADRYLSFEWKNITPASYLHYFSKGDRTENEDQMFGKRTALGSLMLGECVKNDGSYLEAVINGIFSICEETTWSVAAHIDSCGHKDVDVLPAWDDDILDLFAMETAQLVAFAYYLLRQQLDGVSKRITQRMKKELHNRIILPFLNRTDYWWMGYGERKMNNWTPWCTSNAIIAAALTEEEPGLRRAVVEKAVVSLDKFVAGYPEDGSCDEGTSYWFKAGGRLIVALDILQGMSASKLCLKEIEKLHNMSAFIVNARIGGNYYLNFADASALVRQPDAYMIYRMGELLEEEPFLQEGIRLFDRMEDKIVNNSWYSTWNVINSIRYYETLKKGKTLALKEKNVWYPQNQILITSYQGRSFAIKGGHNAESHNHNDVGNYVFYAGAEPVIIDAGVGVYTKDTFSEKRYQIWTMQSQYHNLPIINGVGQKNGAVYQMTTGFEAWDSPCPSGILGTLWMLKTLHPDLYSNEDFVADAQTFYETFYGFTPDAEALAQ